MKRGEVLFQGPIDHKNQQCKINFPGICPKLGGGRGWGEVLSELVEKWKKLILKKMI